MGGFFGAVSKRDCVLDIFFGVDYHSHLGTRRGGMLIFDINSEYKLKKIIGNNTFVSDNDDVFYVWENELLKDKVNFYLTFFVGDGKNYKRFDEMHTQRIYDKNELCNMLKKANFEDINVYADFDVKKPQKRSQRLFVCAKKNAK